MRSLPGSGFGGGLGVAIEHDRDDLGWRRGILHQQLLSKVPTIAFFGNFKPLTGEGYVAPKKADYEHAISRSIAR